MRTSYFGNKQASGQPEAVSIARWSRFWKGRCYMPLAPAVDLLNRYRRGLPWAEYVVEYKRQLAALDPVKVFSDLGKDAILLCYEKPGENCHRRVVAEWLEQNLNVDVPEF